MIERGERERSLDFDGKERKISLIPIYTTKTVDIYVQWFYLMSRVYISCYL